eukprot:6169723-Pyramimonas_sp.AAC.1
MPQCPACQGARSYLSFYKRKADCVEMITWQLPAAGYHVPLTYTSATTVIQSQKKKTDAIAQPAARSSTSDHIPQDE